MEPSHTPAEPAHRLAGDLVEVLKYQIEDLKKLVLAYKLENARLREALNIANFEDLP